jgi:hypothetical protein
MRQKTEIKNNLKLKNKVVQTSKQLIIGSRIGRKLKERKEKEGTRKTEYRREERRKQRNGKKRKK